MAREDCTVRDETAQGLLPSDTDVLVGIGTQADLTATVVMHMSEELNTQYTVILL